MIQAVRFRLLDFSQALKPPSLEPLALKEPFEDQLLR